MKKFIVALSLIAAPLIMTAGDLIVKKGELSVDETIAKIETLVKGHKGMGVFTIIDHQAGAKKAGLQMNEEKVILFGNPKLGTKMMSKDPKTGLDLPLKVLVYKSKKGNTKIVYRDPKKWQKGFDLKGCKLMDKMVQVLDTITTQASQK